MRALGPALVLAACAGTTGTIHVELATAPGSHVLDPVERLRMTLTADPRQVVEAARTTAGFALALELDAGSTAGALIVEGFDPAGALIACGQSPRFAVAAINAHVVVYMAAPMSIALAPASFPARSAVAATAQSFGAVIAGGVESGAASTAIAVYNAFDHSLISGIPLPAARSGLAMAASGSAVYLFGGAGPDGQPTGTLWRFDTGVAPNGAVTTIADQAGFARAGQLLVPIGSDHYLITGTPALELDTGKLGLRSDVAGLPAAGAAVVPGDTNPTAIFAGASLVRYRGNAFDTLAGDGRSNAGAAALPDGRIAVLGGAPASRDALVIDGAAGTVAMVPGVLSVARLDPRVAATPRHVVVAGGTDAGGAPIATADVLDAKTLALIATLPILPRSGGFALALPNDQVLLGGGAPAIAGLELFTPEPPSP